MFFIMGMNLKSLAQLCILSQIQYQNFALGYKLG